MTSAIDRARRDLSGTTIGFVGMSMEANPFRKYSNPDIRYLTYVKLIYFFKKKVVTYADAMQQQNSSSIYDGSN